MKRTSFRFDRSLINHKGDSVRYLEIGMKTPAEASDPGRDRAPMDLALVIDRSGSMSGAPLAAAREAARGVAAGLRPTDTLSVVVFDNHVDLLFEGLPMNLRGKDRADSILSRIESGGMTCLSGGWLRGAEAVAHLREGTEGRRSQVILLSDGHANQGILDPQELAHHASELRERGVYTTCVGIGDGYSPEQLAVLSEHGGGVLHRAEHPHEIIEVLLGELGELMNTYAEDLKVEIELPEDVIAGCIGDLPSSHTPEGICYHLGTLVEGRERHILLRLKCPHGKAGSFLKFRGRITFRRPGSDKREELELKPTRLEFTDSGSSLRKQKRRPKLSLKVALAWQAEIVRKAAGMNRDGAFREAADMVRTQLAFFRRYCRGVRGTSKLIRELTMLQERVRYDISERGRKEMHNYSEVMLKSKPEHRSLHPGELCDFME